MTTFAIHTSPSDFVMGVLLKKEVELDDQKINSRFLKSHRYNLHTGKQLVIDEWENDFSLLFILIG